MDIEALESSVEKEEEGVWHEYRDDSMLRLAAIGNRKFENYLEKLRQPYLRKIRLGLVSQEKLDEITRKAMAKYIILDWKGFTKDGKNFPYSEKNAEVLLDKSRTFRNDVTLLASEDEAYRREDEEQTVKNSKSSSGSTQE